MPTFSQVYALKTAMVAPLAAANRCPPVLKQHSAHALMPSSLSSLPAGTMLQRCGARSTAQVSQTMPVAYNAHATKTYIRFAPP